MSTTPRWQRAAKRQWWAQAAKIYHCVNKPGSKLSHFRPAGSTVDSVFHLTQDKWWPCSGVGSTPASPCEGHEMFGLANAAWEGTAVDLVEVAWVTFWFATYIIEVGDQANPMAECFNPAIRRCGWGSHPLAHDLDLDSDHTLLVLRMLGWSLPIHCLQCPQLPALQRAQQYDTPAI